MSDFSDFSWNYFVDLLPGALAGASLYDDVKMTFFVLQSGALTGLTS